MMKKTIWGHTLVKNEDRYIWFAVKSVINYLDKLLIWDTGSTDNTVEIIKLLQKQYPKKILFKEIGELDANELTKSRQQMLDETDADWILILDGDEIWWNDSITKAISKVNERTNLWGIVVPVYNLIGDIYHYQEEIAGQYIFSGRKGHLNLRLINAGIKGLHLKKAYPQEGYYDKSEKLIQENSDKITIIDAPVLHFTYLPRSTNENQNIINRNKKLKYEIGTPFDDNFKFPEVLYEDYPPLVSSPWQRMSNRYKTRAIIETPLKKIKRRIFSK